jgi:MOSC domain-containing protein YiiM
LTESSGRVLRIFVSPDAGVPMKEVTRIHAIAGVGLENDRYAVGIEKGVYSHSSHVTTRHVSLIAIEAIGAANKELAEPFDPSETRRNIVTQGIVLAELLGKEFTIGNVLLRGVEPCLPCARPSALTGKPCFDRAFQDRGGLRAEILSSGTISVDDEILADGDQSRFLS